MRFLRSVRQALVFVVVLILTLFIMQKFGMIDLGTGNVQVIDGDSLRLGTTDIRLYGIDAPEYRQICLDQNRMEYACGKRAASALRDMVRGRQVNCSSVETDRYGRAVSLCKIDKLDINGELVRQGWAVAYVQHSLNYVRIEADAKRAKRGIWAGTFEAPADYRARNHSIHGGLGGEETGAARED
jgi:endonuclease YncB( thermonuclease family)